MGEVREKGGRIVVVFNVANVRPNSVQATPIRFWALKVLGLRM